MKFGIHNSSWLETPDPSEAFEVAKAKALEALGLGPMDEPTLGMTVYWTTSHASSLGTRERALFPSVDVKTPHGFLTRPETGSS